LDYISLLCFLHWAGCSVTKTAKRKNSFGITIHPNGEARTWGDCEWGIMAQAAVTASWRRVCFAFQELDFTGVLQVCECRGWRTRSVGHISKSGFLHLRGSWYMAGWERGLAYRLSCVFDDFCSNCARYDEEELLIIIYLLLLSISILESVNAYTAWQSLPSQLTTELSCIRYLRYTPPRTCARYQGETTLRSW
jgi:hypothetical protein